MPNYSFETYTTCPSALGGVNPLECIPWEAVAGTVDYFNACSGPSSPVGVPYNFQGFQFALTGVAYGGIYTRANGNSYREYFQVELDEALEENGCYRVGFHINLANEACGIDRIGALLSVDPISNPLGEVPQLNWIGPFLSDTLNWYEINGYIIAEGGEQYITLGNFYNDTETILDTACTFAFPFNYSYYYIDDVTVVPFVLEVFDIDLGGPVQACDQFLIDPGMPDVEFNWNTGETGPTLTVFESGTYTGIAHFECNIYSVEITVDIPVDNPIDLGPDQVFVCEGDIYEINLDPSLGDYIWQDGSTATTYFINSSGSYSVTVDNGCFVNSDQVTIIVETLPEPAFLGEDLQLCPGDEIVFDFDPSIGAITWLDNSHAYTYIIDQGGTYGVTITNSCGEVSDIFHVEEIDIPNFSFPADEYILCHGESFFATVDPSLGEYEWQDGSDQPVYEITAEGTYSLTVSNACGAHSDFFTVIEEPLPFVDLPPDAAACQGDTIILEIDSSTGDILWHNLDTTETLEVTNTGMYSVTVSNACGEASDSIYIEFLPLPLIPQLGPDLDLCPGQQVVLSVSSPGSSILWSDQSSADTLVVSSEGIYFVDVFNACGMHSDTVAAVFNADPPDLTLPADFALCQGTSTSLDAGIAGVTYLWSNGSTQAHFQINQPGVYALTITNACGSDADSIVIMDGGPAPFVSLGQDTSFCDSTSITLMPQFTDVDSWYWQDSSVQNTFVVTTPGSFTIEAFNSCGVSYDTILIGVLPAIPNLFLGPDASICPGDSVLLSIAHTDVDILWTTGSVQPMIWVNDAEVITATISNSCGISSDTILISLLPEIPTLDLGPDQTICPGEIIEVSPEINNVQYLWQDGSMSTMYSASQEGWVILTISNSCSTRIDSLFIIESTEGPQIDLGPDLIGCEGDTISISSFIGGVDYLWQDGYTGPVYSATLSGTLILSVSNLCGSDRDTINIDLSGLPPYIYLGPDTILCTGADLLLQSGADTHADVLWQDGSNTLSLWVTQPGQYSLIASNNCGLAYDSISISYLDPPVSFDLGSDTVLCPGASALLTAPVTTNELLWQDGSKTNTFLAEDEGIYSLLVINECGTETDSLYIAYADEMIHLNLEPLIPWCAGDTFLLDATQPFVTDYAWSTGETSPAITIHTSGLYAVTVTSTCNERSEEVEVMERPDCTGEIAIKLPNIFSPNNDHVNDVFSIPLQPDLDIESNTGEIFDRWGNQVYSSSSVPFSWDGKSRGQWMQPGVYVYVIDIRYMDSGVLLEQRLVGNITLLR